MRKKPLCIEDITRAQVQYTVDHLQAGDTTAAARSLRQVLQRVNGITPSQAQKVCWWCMDLAGI